MKRIELITSVEYWREAFETYKYNDYTKEEINEDIVKVINEAFDLGVVSQQRELLIAYEKYHFGLDYEKSLKGIDEFLEANNSNL